MAGDPIPIMTANLSYLSRRPQRLTITVSHYVAENLIQQSTDQGRSISNLAAYLLERALTEPDSGSPIKKRWPGQG
jgi:hypothetical protein